MFAAAILLALPLAGQQQENSAPAPQQNSAPAKNPPAKKDAQPAAQKGQTPAPTKPSEAEQNPFPEAQSEAAAQHSAQQQPSQDAPSAPEPKPGADQNHPSEAQQNPFPEGQSQKAAGKNADRDQAPASGGGSADPSQDYSSSQTGLKNFQPPAGTESGKDMEGDGTTADPARAHQDTQVGMFYLQTHDYKGAYERFAEATRVDPGNADAVFGLAEAAEHMNHRDEAIRNYRLYLSALPDGPRAKEVRKALKAMGVAPES